MNIEIAERLRAQNIDPLVSLIRLAESDRMPVEQAEALLWKIHNLMTTTAVVAPIVEETAPEIPEEVRECEVLDEPVPFSATETGRKRRPHLKPQELQKIVELLKLGQGQSEIARRFDVTPSTIWRIKTLNGL